MGNNKIVVLGCGYLGYNAAEFFFRRGAETTVVARPSLYSSQLSRGIACHGYSLETLEQLMDEETVLLYAVGSINATNKLNDLEGDITGTYFDFIRMLDAISRKKAVIAFLSSAGTIYGNSVNGKIFSEDDCPNPGNIYALQKVYFENIIKIFGIEKGLRYLILRVSNPYGGFMTGSRNQGAVPIFCNKIKREEPIELWVSKDTRRDFLYIDDMLEMITAIIVKKEWDQLYNIAYGESFSLGYLINMIERLLNKKANVIIRDERINDIYLNVDKFTSKYGIRPATPLECGVDSLLKG